MATQLSAQRCDRRWMNSSVLESSNPTTHELTYVTSAVDAAMQEVGSKEQHDAEMTAAVRGHGGVAQQEHDPLVHGSRVLRVSPRALHA